MVSEYLENLHFGFSYSGLVFLLMLLVPNIVWTKFKPVDYEKYAANENRFLSVLEKTGQVLCTGTVLLFSDFNVRFCGIWISFLVAGFLLMFLYEVYWVRYFMSEKTMWNFYRPMGFVPLPGALLPVVAFVLLGIYGRNLFLISGALILGIGHVGIHACHWHNVKNDLKGKN